MGKHRSPRLDAKDLEKFGPRLGIEIGLPITGGPEDLNAARFSQMPALIDTGAARTVLTPQAIERVNLPLVDYTMVSRAGGVDPADVYAASIRFPRDDLKAIELIQVICCELPHQPIQCLLGRDVLSRWLFTYNGQTGDWLVDDRPNIVPWVEPPEDADFDVFICHASEDKPFVDPLVTALKAAGIKVWYDKDKMKWGDNLRTFIDNGLLNSRFGIVVLSNAFLRGKRWTEHEFNGLFAKESAGRKVILPIRHGITSDDLVGYSPSFLDRISMDSHKNSIEEIVRNLKAILERRT